MTDATAMTPLPFLIQRCPDRAVIAVRGETAKEFLQNLLTVDVSTVSIGKASYGALLSPQGKILHDMFIVIDGDTLLLDCDRAQATILLQKLTFYRLRAKLELTLRDDLEVGVWLLSPLASGLARVNNLHPSPVGGRWREPTDEGLSQHSIPQNEAKLPDTKTLIRPSGTFPQPGKDIDQLNAMAEPNKHVMPELVYADPRLAELGWRCIAPKGSFTPAENYNGLCQGLGIPSSAALVGQFAHEANLDQLGGLSFEKGCYVGQEIVSRMEHRGTARSRMLPIQGTAALGSEIRSGDILVGTVVETGIGLFRIDRLAEATAALMVGDAQITVSKPNWLKIDFTLPEIVQ